MNKLIEIEQIAAVLDLKDLSSEEEDAILQKAGASIVKAVMVRVIPLLSDDAKTKLETLLATAAPGEDSPEIAALLEKEIPDLDHIVAEEVEVFKADAALFKDLK